MAEKLQRLTLEGLKARRDKLLEIYLDKVALAPTSNSLYKNPRNSVTGAQAMTQNDLTFQFQNTMKRLNDTSKALFGVDIWDEQEEEVITLKGKPVG